jgi:hypothetical protein
VSRRLLLMVGVTVTMAAACGTAAGGTITLDGKQANDHGRAFVSFGGNKTVEVDDYFFAPTVLSIPVGNGGVRTFIFRSVSGTTHNISLAEQGIDIDIDPGSSVEVSVRLEPDATLVFACRFHEDRGMVGAFDGQPG